jgi:hypothetical protein
MVAAEHLLVLQVQELKALSMQENNRQPRHSYLNVIGTPRVHLLVVVEVQVMQVMESHPAQWQRA